MSDSEITLQDVTNFLNAVNKLYFVFGCSLPGFDIKDIIDRFKMVHRDLFPINSEYQPRSDVEINARIERQKEILDAIYRIKDIREFADKIAKSNIFQGKVERNKIVESIMQLAESLK